MHRIGTSKRKTDETTPRVLTSEDWRHHQRQEENVFKKPNRHGDSPTQTDKYQIVGVCAFDQSKASKIVCN